MAQFQTEPAEEVVDPESDDEVVGVGLEVASEFAELVEDEEDPGEPDELDPPRASFL